MNESMSSTPVPTPMPEEPKKNNTWLIVGIVVVVLCCLCVIVLGVGYQFGDQILRALGMG